MSGVQQLTTTGHPYRYTLPCSLYGERPISEGAHHDCAITFQQQSTVRAPSEGRGKEILSVPVRSMLVGALVGTLVEAVMHIRIIISTETWFLSSSPA